MTRYTAEHLAAAHKLGLHLGSKATERIAQALADHEQRGLVRERARCAVIADNEWRYEQIAKRIRAGETTEKG